MTHHTFTDKHGNIMQLRGDLTIEDLVRMGVSDIRLAEPGTPLKENEWVCRNAIDTTTPKSEPSQPHDTHD
jgi:hypothetical protein